MSDQPSFSTEISTGSELAMDEMIESIREIITEGTPELRDACEDPSFDGNLSLAGSPAVDLELSQFWDAPHNFVSGAMDRDAIFADNILPQPAEAFDTDDELTDEVSGPLKDPQLAIEADDLNLVKSLMGDLLDDADEQGSQIDLDDGLSIPDVDEAAIPATETVTSPPHSIPIEEPSRPLEAVKTDAILDELTETATAGAFAELSQAVENNAVCNEPGPRIGELVQDALRPMLKTWLDANLTAIVECAVATEIKRISSGN